VFSKLVFAPFIALMSLLRGSARLHPAVFCVTNLGSAAVEAAECPY